MAAPKKPTLKIACLKCGKQFDSVDRCRNRICYRCNYENEIAFNKVIDDGVRRRMVKKPGLM